MLFGETVAVYCENRTEHTDTLYGQNAAFWYVKAGDVYSNHSALRVNKQKLGKDSMIICRDDLLQ
jgi:hypothetical protein